jgi:glycosyltransferase involved in cell wall biosynthesis
VQLAAGPAETKTAADSAEYTDTNTAADYTEYTDEKRAADLTEHADTKTAADYTDDTDKKTAADSAKSTDQKARDRAFTIAYAGHLYPWKGVDLVIEAIAGMQDVHGLIIGGHAAEPDLARVQDVAKKLYCSLRTTFTGMIAPADVAARLREADVLVLPNPSSALSREFTSPLKLFEYMAAGRPIVASDLPSLREVLTDGHNAVLVEPGNPQALTAGIRRIKDDPELGRRLAAQALADVREYTWARRAERLERLFDEVLAGA